MTITLPDDRTVKPFGLQSSRISVPSASEQPASDVAGASDGFAEHVDGDLLQARALAEKHPDSPTSLARLAASELSFGNRVSARAAADQTLTSDSLDPPAMLVAAHTFLALGEIDSADQALQRVLGESGAGEGAKRAAAALAARIAARNGQPHAALELLEQCDDLAGLTLKGTLLIETGRYHDAIRALRAALNEAPDSPEALCNLGYAYAAAGSVRKAMRSTLAATALDPTDRTAGLNLASLMLPKDAAGTVDVIDRLISYHPDDLRLVRAAAAAMYEAGDRTGALRRLRRLQGSTRLLEATPVEREEFNLDVLLLSEQHKVAPSYAFEHAAQALKRCEYRSAAIARLLAAAATTSKDLPILERAYGELLKQHERTALFAVEYTLALLRFDFDRCVDVSEEWMQHEPFSADAHVAATYVLASYAGRYSEAARAGLTALRRGIHSDGLRNNTAFALAMDGRPDQAARVLPDLSECELALATAGLIEAVRGDVDRGVKMYGECADQLRSDGRDDVAELVSLYQLLAEVVGGKEQPEGWFEAVSSRCKSADPRFAIIFNAITREAARSGDFR